METCAKQVLDHTTGNALTPDRINQELCSFYTAVIREFLERNQVPNEYVGPFLVACPPGYVHLQYKWMYVGQETCGWDTVRAIEDVSAIMEMHADFNLAEHYSGAGGPFWSFGHALDLRLNPKSPRRSFIWSNLARIGKVNDEGRVPNLYLSFWSDRRLLAKEIELAAPDLVLFVTGPRYDDLLRLEFPSVELPDLSLATPVQQISHPDLPRCSFRSYHPKYLRLNGLEQAVMDLVVERTR